VKARSSGCAAELEGVRDRYAVRANSGRGTGGGPAAAILRYAPFGA
jgi:hypothetical protein